MSSSGKSCLPEHRDYVRLSVVLRHHLHRTSQLQWDRDLRSRPSTDCGAIGKTCNVNLGCV